jgi:hypothetical protein
MEVEGLPSLVVVLMVWPGVVVVEGLPHGVVVVV